MTADPTIAGRPRRQQALVEGVITESTRPPARAELSPRPDRRCVVVHGG